MIEKVTNNPLKAELLPYSVYGSKSRNQNQSKNQNQKERQKFDEFDKDENKTNPFDGESNEKDNKIQEYFNQRYAKINTDIKDVVLRISKKSKYAQAVDSAIIDSQALVARYLYNKTLPCDEDKIFKFSQKDAYCSIEVFDKLNNPLLKVDFTKSSIIKIKTYFESFYFEIDIKKENILNRILGNSKIKLAKCQKKDLQGNLLEEIYYSSGGQIERYLSYNSGKLQSEICFDLSIAHFRPDYKEELIPLKYSLYDINNEHKLENLLYTYCLPNKYQQYNNTTGKIVKSFTLQGLKSKVVKYAFFNSINGQMTACGSL